MTGFLRPRFGSPGIYSINGGILTSTVLGQPANNLSNIATAELNFVQISDNHIGFNKPANTDVVGTCRETIARVNALPKTPEFLLHTGDLKHLSDAAQFDTLAQPLKDCRTKDVFYVPGEHDIYDNGAQFKERFGKNSKGSGWYSFDQKGVHFIGLVNVANIQEAPGTNALWAVVWAVVNGTDNIRFPFHRSWKGSGSDDYGKRTQAGRCCRRGITGGPRRWPRSRCCTCQWAKVRSNLVERY